MGRDGSVGVATRCGLDGQGSCLERGKGGGLDFSHSFTLAIGPTQRPVEWVSGLFPRVKVAGPWR